MILPSEYVQDMAARAMFADLFYGVKPEQRCKRGHLKSELGTTRAGTRNECSACASDRARYAARRRVIERNETRLEEILNAAQN